MILLYSYFVFCQAEEEEEDIKAAVPALLRGGEDPVSPTDWDSTVTTLVQSSIVPQCSTLGGDLYILTGAGGLGVAEDGDEECQTKPLWSAVCCAVPEGKTGFSMGLIRETEEGERQVSVKELQETLGVEELFSEGCGGTTGESGGIGVGLGELGAGVTGGEEVGAGVTEEEEVVSGAAAGEGGGSSLTEEAGAGAAKGDEASLDATEREEVGSGATGQDSTSEGSNKSKRAGTTPRDAGSQSPESAAQEETVDEQDKDTNSSSTLVYILSTTLSILKAPLQPVFSTVTQLPGQVIQYTE